MAEPTKPPITRWHDWMPGARDMSTRQRLAAVDPVAIAQIDPADRQDIEHNIRQALYDLLHERNLTEFFEQFDRLEHILGAPDDLNQLERTGFNDAIRIGNLAIVERRPRWPDFLRGYLNWREQLATLPEGRRRNTDVEAGFFNAVVRNRLTEADHIAEMFNLPAAEIDKSVKSALHRLLGWGAHPKPDQAIKLRDHFQIPAADFQHALEESLRSNALEPKKFETLVTGLQVGRETIVKAVITKALGYVKENWDMSQRTLHLKLLLQDHPLTTAEQNPLADQIVQHYFQVLEQDSYISGKPIDDLELLIKDFPFIHPAFVAAAEQKVLVLDQNRFPSQYVMNVRERLRKVR